MLKTKLVTLVLLSAILLTSLSACSGQSNEGNHLEMMPLDKMPARVQSAPVLVQTAYQFNAANPDLMKEIPCYCGCGDIGHVSNYDCYIANVDDKGAITFDNHALGCSICVDITQDAMRMLKDGKSPGEIRAAIDQTYARYGPSSMP
jgi:hypothetical protein